MRPAVVFLGSLVLFVLLAEGVLSLAAGRSLRDLLRARSRFEGAAPVELATDRAGFAAAARTAGPFRAAEDPLVGHTFKASTTVEFAGQRFATDALGLRARTGPAAPEDAFRIVLLGGTEAFGVGLPAGETLAERLEAELAAVRGPGARAIVCSTVAVPGWSARSAVRHLLDRLTHIDPDVVLFVLESSGLEAGYEVDEVGTPRRRARAKPFLCPLVSMSEARNALAVPQPHSSGAPWAFVAGASHTARAQVADLADDVQLLEARLARRGAWLVLAPLATSRLLHLLCARLPQAGATRAMLPLLADWRPEDVSGDPPRLTATTLELLARWMAEGLIARGLVPGPLAHEDAGWEARRADGIVGARVGAPGSEDSLGRRIEPERRLGLAQVYGGVATDGTLGIEALAVLPPGHTLVVELASVVDAPGLYPLVMEVAIDGRPVGEVVLREPAPHTVAGRFELAPAEPAAPFEVRLAARDWALGKIGGETRPVSARLVALESVER